MIFDMSSNVTILTNMVLEKIAYSHQLIVSEAVLRSICDDVIRERNAIDVDVEAIMTKVRQTLAQTIAGDGDFEPEM